MLKTKPNELKAENMKSKSRKPESMKMGIRKPESMKAETGKSENKTAKDDRMPIYAYYKQHLALRYTLYLVLAVIIIASLSFFISSKDEGDFDPREDAWYEVEDWEVEVCSMWGGGAEAQSYSGSGITTTSAASGFEIATIQGQKTAYRMSSNVTSYFYEVSWYYQPMVGSCEYKVSYESGGNMEIIAEGSATAQMGDGSYNAEQFSKDPKYKYVIIEYGVGFSKSIKSKIQEKNIN